MWARRLIRTAKEAGGKVLELDRSHVLIAVGEGRWYIANPEVICHAH
jgi:hypothetical protein